MRAWDRLGYPRRALTLHPAASAIVENHGGVVPHEVDALLALPSVGPCGAEAVAAFAFGDRHPVVDTNVRRAIDGIAEAGPRLDPNRPRGDGGALLKPDDADRGFNASAMELGALVCTARSLRCDT